ncbi:MAG: uroporphyrinogen decarboxylase family protein [Bacteroidales bacterium]|nr:uroporphyrinogen decarboxylase family protein [Bacteroidales bacterium]
MNSKQNLAEVLNHRQGAKIPIDFGGSSVTGVHVFTVEKLRAYYGLPWRPVRVIEPYQMLGEVDSELVDAVGIDVLPMMGRSTILGTVNEGWREFKTFWGQTVLVSADFGPKYDDNGDLLSYPEGDISVEPSARMPKSGYFFDAIERETPPFDDSNPNVEDNLEEFGAISDQDLAHFKSLADGLRGSGKGVLGSFGGTALGDIALVPGMSLKHPKGIRGIAEWYMSTLTRSDYIMELFERQTDIAIENLKKIHSVVGDVADAAFTCGTDFGTQNSLFCDADTFSFLYKPYYKKVNDWIHSNTNWKTFKHSCGAVFPLIAEFIDAGFDIVNPVQINADGMDPKKLKETYGDRITFWGGGIDTQKILPYGTPEEVREHVLRQCEIFGKNGGFVFNAVHNVQANVPIENFGAALEAVKEFNGEK